MNFRKRLVFDDSLAYYKTHLDLVNILLPKKLTNKEVEILSHFMNERMDVHAFGATSKKIVREKLNLSDSNLSNHLRRIAPKGIIEFYLDGGVKRTKFVDNIIPDVNQLYEIKLQYEGPGDTKSSVSRLQEVGG